ncbi:uncharacterized protein LOC124366904 [Homalodisca vitripennis]|uniref:uncharacterized protein LOC124366904 n=1 Tax=Homalodisca vitripennis TaxID=197043 RepID=UPI001EECC9D3|nr:uncharacterized protein LOC124366904 [Homalodisca vitripennis]
MYADDTVITLAENDSESLTTNTERALNRTKKYCAPNNLVLNVDKTVQIIFNTRLKNTETSVGRLHEYKTNTKYLGVTINSDLSWKTHIDLLCRKISSGAFLIRRLRQISTPEAAKTAYYAFLETHLRFGIATWGGTSATNLDRVLIQQKKAIRSLTGLEQRESCRAAFVEQNILTVVSLYIQEVILHTVSTETTKTQRYPPSLHQACRKLCPTSSPPHSIQQETIIHWCKTF